MADYQPLISRAVAGLEHNTGENRRVLYERARAALVNQLRNADPPLEESEISRERVALEEAIRKVEAEAAAQQAAAEQAPAPEQHANSLTDRGLRGFRDTVAEAEGLGDAAAEARRSARDFYRQVPSDEAQPAPPAAEREQPATTHYFEPHEGEAHEGAPHEAALHEGEPEDEGDFAHEAPPHGHPPYHGLPEGALPPPPPPYDEHEEAYGRAPRPWGRIVTIAVLILAIAGLAGAGYWQRHTIASLVASFRAAPVKPKQAAAPPAAQPKITDRVQKSEGAPKTATAPAAAVAQKVVLYEEDANNPKGKRYVGSAIWHTETVSPGSGLAPELAVRADVEIPERHMRMTLSLRRNTDKALPASHTIEIQFTLPADFPEGGIGNVPGVLMKSNESGRGVPLAGLAVKVTNGYFLIGLSAVQVDRERNIEMLKNRDWFDVPIVYTSGKRAILAMEKGTPGQRAFAEAFRAWGE
jgi:hypothetical protein